MRPSGSAVICAMLWLVSMHVANGSLWFRFQAPNVTRSRLAPDTGSEVPVQYPKDVIVLSARFFKSTHRALCPFVALHQTSLFCSFSISDRCSSSTFWSESYCATNLRLQLLHNGRHRRERNTVNVWSTERRLDKIIA
jgi:hypothetical protein